jgi:hypothetical protein
MKQATTSKPLTRFEMIDMHLNTILRLNTSHLEGARERLFAEGQFDNSFKWECEEIYKMMYQNRHLRNIQDSLILAAANQVLDEKIQYWIKFFEGQLLGSYINRSTNPLANVASEWEFESKQVLYKLMIEIQK